jgi:hypothetical protein
MSLTPFSSTNSATQFGLAGRNLNDYKAFASPMITTGQSTYQGTFSGAHNGTWLPIMEAQVQAAYDQYRLFEPLVTQSTIESGKAKIFPITGTVGLRPVWGAGDELFGGATQNSATFVIELDDRPMAAHFETDRIDLLTSQWEFRAEYARQCGERLANTRDAQILQTIIRGSALAAHTGDPRDVLGGLVYGPAIGANVATTSYANLQYLGITALPGNSVIAETAVTEAQRASACQDFLRAIRDAIIVMKGQNISPEGFCAAVSVQAFHDLMDLGVPLVNSAATDAFGAQFNPKAGAQYANTPMWNIPGFGNQYNATIPIAMSQYLVYQGVKIFQSTRLTEIFTNMRIKTTTPALLNGIPQTVRTGSATVATILVSSLDSSMNTHLGNIAYGQANKYGMASGPHRLTSPLNTSTRAFGSFEPWLTTLGTSLASTDPLFAGADVRAVMWKPEAVVALNKIGMMVESVKDARRGSWFTCFSRYGGTGVLKPECCVAFIGNTGVLTKQNYQECLFGAAGDGAASNILGQLRP